MAGGRRLRINELTPGRGYSPAPDGHPFQPVGPGCGEPSGHRGCAVRIDQSTRDGCAILAPVGELDLAAVPSLRQVLVRRLSEQPVAVICDLSRLASVDEACATVFATVANHPSSRWPETNLVLCGAQPAVAAVLEHLSVPQYLPVHPTIEDALARAVARPPYLRDELPLAPSPTAPATARRFIRDTCRQWRLDAAEDPTDRLARPWMEELVDRAVLVASELVTNAVIHTQGPVRLRLEWRQERLYVAVSDRLPRLLGLAAEPGDPDAEGGRGLVIVDQLATRWGVQHPPGGGKVIWCMLER